MDSSAAGRLVNLWRRLTRNPLTVLSLVALLILLAMSFVPHWLTRYPPNELDALTRLNAPSAEHWFGTDHLGRDVYTRIIYGTRASFGAAILIVALAAALGTTIGVIAGYAGRRVDDVIMRVVDLFLAFPLLVLALAIVAALGPGRLHSMLALVLVWWAQYARLMRGQVMQIREREYVHAAQMIGAPPLRILRRHILPNTLSPLLVKGTLDVAVAVLVNSSLSFLGLGVQPPEAEWGAMITYGRAFIFDAWWYPSFPGLAIFITVMTVNTLGDGVRDALNPRLRME